MRRTPRHRSRTMPFSGAALLAAALLTACTAGPTSSGADSSDSSSSSIDSSAMGSPAESSGAGESLDPAESSSAAESGGEGAGAIVLPGTGNYSIGTEAPYGGYQLHGEPDEQPAGCTWSIEDADGEVAFENQGAYAFLTDIREAVTFVTKGCPDWEKFE